MSAPLNEPALASHREAARILARALRYLAPFRKRVMVKLGLGALSLLPMLLLPWPVKVLVDQVIDDVPASDSKVPWPVFVRPAVKFLDGLGPTDTIFWAVGFQAVLLLLVGAVGTSGREQDQTQAWLSGGHDTATRTENEANAGFSLAGGLLGWFDFRWTLRLVQDLNHHYRSRLFGRIQSLPMAAFDDERIGDALYRVMYDAPSITNGCFRIVLTPVLATLMILMTTAVLASTFGDHPTLVVSALAVLPLTLLITLPFAGALRRRGGASRSAGAGTTSTVEEGITNMLAVQSQGGEGRERARFDRDSWESFTSYRSLVRIVVLTITIGIVPMLLLYGHVFFYSVDLVIAGAVSVGDFTLLLTYFAILAAASSEIGTLWFNVQSSAAGLQRVFFLMDLPGEREAEGSRKLGELHQGIRLEGVSFAYPGAEPTLHDVDLDLAIGKFTALVGPAGAGKTTLAYLLSGFLAPTRGRVSADGQDLREFTHASLRGQLAFVFQETALFDESIEANLKLARPEAREAELRRALRLAGAEEFVSRLPEGLATRLGRGGGKLSVGQKQRLSIARALLRDAPVLVLDEPTSALDPETERHLVHTLSELRRDRAVLVIAHRLSTIRAADEICFLEAGRISERGTHDELMALPHGAYRRFVDLQTRGAA